MRFDKIRGIKTVNGFRFKRWRYWSFYIPVRVYTPQNTDIKVWFVNQKGGVVLPGKKQKEYLDNILATCPEILFSRIDITNKCVAVSFDEPTSVQKLKAFSEEKTK